MSTFVSLHFCLSFCEWLTFTSSSLSPSLFISLCIHSHSFLPTYCFPPESVFCSLYPAHPPSLISSCVLHRYCTFFHNICLLFSFFVFFISLLGDPLVTSSLLQLPWFQGKGTVITVWIKQTDLVLLYRTHTHTQTQNQSSWRSSKEFVFITASRQFAGLGVNMSCVSICVCVCVCDQVSVNDGSVWMK